MRTLDFTQSVKRKREEQQEAAAKAKAEGAPAAQPANQVNFSQAAQIRLSQELSQETNRVQAIRVENNTKAVEAYSESLRQEAKKAVEIKNEDRKLKAQREIVREAKAEAAAQSARNLKEEIQKIAALDMKRETEETAKGVEKYANLAREAERRTSAIIVSRGIERQADTKKRLDDKVAAEETANNAALTKRLSDHAAEAFKETKALNERARIDAEKALKIYTRVSSKA